MLDKAVCYVSGWLQSFRHRLYISQTYLAWCSKKTNASWWHAYAITHRPWRPHVCIPCEWITQLVPGSARVFEVGCGSGANLIWLQQKGFQNLGGSDIAASAIEMCNLLASYYKASINTVVDDALHPQFMPKNVDVLLSVNWLYHIPGASLDDMLNVYGKCVNPGGYMAFDCISARYNSKPNNAYHTADLRLPPAKRRPSEYTFRMTSREVENCASRYGYIVQKKRELRTFPPRNVYVAKRCL